VTDDRPHIRVRKVLVFEYTIGQDYVYGDEIPDDVAGEVDEAFSRAFDAQLNPEKNDLYTVQECVITVVGSLDRETEERLGEIISDRSALFNTIVNGRPVFEVRRAT
jgi:hypothetical protein